MINQSSKYQFFHLNSQKKTLTSPRKKISTQFILNSTLNILFSLSFFTLFALSTQAASLGIHILHPDEINSAAELFATDLNEKDEIYQGSPNIYYVTIPFPLDEPMQAGAIDKWQKFFDECQKKSTVPLVRLTTTFDIAQNSWAIPSRQQITQSIDFLAQLNWPQSQKKHLIVFNEPNHHAEWGGQANPASYADILSFTSNWARSSDQNFYILPAGLDLAAPNGSTTMEAFTYLEKMIDSDPHIIDRIDAWNSHSYPNPAFSSPPDRKGQNSLYGYLNELTWLDQKATRKLQVYITETGWEENVKTKKNLNNWYQTAWENIWSTDSRITAITPFILKGAPGPFAKFSLIDKDGRPTTQYEAFSKVISQNRTQNQFSTPEF